MLRAVAIVSAFYDGIVGVVLITAPALMASWFGVLPPQPPIFADLNGLFLVSIAAGYWVTSRDAERRRWYLWVMGPGLKGAGAVTFVLDYLVRHSPASFLLFAASDGTLALVTLAVLVASRSTSAPRPQSAAHR